MDLSQYDTKKSGRKILSKKQLSTIGMGVLEEHMPEVLKSPKAVDIEALIEDEFGLDIRMESIYRDEQPVIGMCAFFDGHLEIPAIDHCGKSDILELSEGNIVIEESLKRLKKYHRMRHTMAHELSHWILHRGYFSPAEGEYSFRTVVACREGVLTGAEKKMRGKFTDADWLEFQANCLGAAILMPEEPFREVFKSECLDNHIMQDFIICDRDPVAENLIVRSLMNVFSVSRKSAEIRLRDLGLLVRDGAKKEEVV